jgi:hypothetical protein
MRFALLAATTAAVVLAGCTSEVPRGRVHGTIKINGKPLTAATVIFIASDNKTHVVDLKSDGSYEVSGVAFGTVKVSIQPVVPKSAVKGEFDPPPLSSAAKGVTDEKAGKSPNPPPEPKGSSTPRVPPQYAEASALTFELKAADQEWSVDLK